MKIPKNKLPLNLGNRMLYGQYAILCKHPKPTKFQTGKFAGQIAGKDLSQYVVKAANEFPEAIDILNTLKKDAEMALNGDWDRSDSGFFAQIKLITKFLNKLEDEKS